MHAAIAIWIESGMYHIDFLPYLADEIDLRRPIERLKTAKEMLMPSEIVFKILATSYFDRYLEPLQDIVEVPQEVDQYCTDIIDYLFCSMHKNHDIPSIHYELRHLAMAVIDEYEKAIEDIVTADIDSRDATMDWISRYEQLVEFYKGVLPTR